MRTVRNTLLAAATTAVLSMSGWGTQVANIAIEIKNGLVRMAEAAEQDRRDFRTPGVHIRSEPSTGSPARGVGNPGEHATIRQTVNGETVTCPDGTTNSEWLNITDRQTRVSGFVSACFL
jgi:hypothetical protein